MADTTHGKGGTLETTFISSIGQDRPDRSQLERTGEDRVSVSL